MKTLLMNQLLRRNQQETDSLSEEERARYGRALFVAMSATTDFIDTQIVFSQIAKELVGMPVDYPLFAVWAYQSACAMIMTLSTSLDDMQMKSTLKEAAEFIAREYEITPQILARIHELSIFPTQHDLQQKPN